MAGWTKTVAAGAWAGCLATVSMTAFMKGGQSVGLLGEAPPRKITRWALRKLGLARAAGDTGRAVATTVAHFGFGAATGAGYALLRRTPWVPKHPITGAAYGALI